MPVSAMLLLDLRL